MAADKCTFWITKKEADRLSSQGDLEKAQELYTQFIEQERGSSEDKSYLALARNNRGQLKYLTVDFRGAVEDYTGAIQLDPNLAVSYYNRGQIHYRLGRFNMAIEDLRRCVELDPDFNDARENLNQAELDLAEKTEAQRTQ